MQLIVSGVEDYASSSIYSWNFVHGIATHFAELTLGASSICHIFCHPRVIYHQLVQELLPFSKSSHLSPPPSLSLGSLFEY